MSANTVAAATGSNSRNASIDQQEIAKTVRKPLQSGNPETAVRQLCLVEDRVSRWSLSSLKRLFDIGCVALALPFLLPLFLIIGLAVRLTSKGPVLFRQKRTGMSRRNFTILKFRTMEILEEGARSKVTTAGNQPFTPIGPFLRRWKLDELPQLFNVLIGNMSLVGPRPKLPEHQLAELRCRPGITGAATITFAREEHILAQLPHQNLDNFYHSIILPAKLRIDREYMTRATFLSDLELIVNTVLRRWDGDTIRKVLEIDARKKPENTAKGKTPAPVAVSPNVLTITPDESLASAD